MGNQIQTQTHKKHKFAYSPRKCRVLVNLARRIAARVAKKLVNAKLVRKTAIVISSVARKNVQVDGSGHKKFNLKLLKFRSYFLYVQKLLAMIPSKWRNLCRFLFNKC